MGIVLSSGFGVRRAAH